MKQDLCCHIYELKAWLFE